MLLNDFMEVPAAALRFIASTVLASSFVSGFETFFGDSLFPTLFPIVS